MARSLNKVSLIGNLTKDPELRYTPSGAAVCNFSVATNREWTDSAGQKKEEASFHKIVVWQKLAEICSQYLHKGSKVYVEGRLANRTWEDQNGIKRYEVEIVMEEMLMLDNKGSGQAQVAPVVDNPPEPPPPPEPVKIEPVKTEEKVEPKKEKLKENISPDDIPF